MEIHWKNVRFFRFEPQKGIFLNILGDYWSLLCFRNLQVDLQLRSTLNWSRGKNDFRTLLVATSIPRNTVIVNNIICVTLYSGPSLGDFWVNYGVIHLQWWIWNFRDFWLFLKIHSFHICPDRLDRDRDRKIDRWMLFGDLVSCKQNLPPLPLQYRVPKVKYYDPTQCDHTSWPIHCDPHNLA